MEPGSSRKDVQPSTSKGSRGSHHQGVFEAGGSKWSRRRLYPPQSQLPLCGILGPQRPAAQGSSVLWVRAPQHHRVPHPPKVDKGGQPVWFPREQESGASGAGILQQQSGCQDTPCKVSNNRTNALTFATSVTFRLRVC